LSERRGIISRDRYPAGEAQAVHQSASGEDQEISQALHTSPQKGLQKRLKNGQNPGNYSQEAGIEIPYDNGY
jgi:hypothetical protein